MGERAHEQILDGWKIGLLGGSTEEGLEEGFLGDTDGVTPEDWPRSRPL